MSNCNNCNDRKEEKKENLVLAQNILYFNSTKRYTLRLLETLSTIPFFVPEKEIVEDGRKLFYDREFTLPLKFGIYEKCIALKDLSEETLSKSHITQYLPRAVLVFDGMDKAFDRHLNKRNVFSKSVDLRKLCENYGIETVNICHNTDDEYYRNRDWYDYKQSPDCEKVKFSFASVPYNFNYRLIIQGRGLSQTMQIVETVLAKFDPSIPLRVFEYPLFDDQTLTQVIAGDPSFDFSPSYDLEDVNIVNVEIPLMVKGNLYKGIETKGHLKAIGMFMGIWDGEDKYDSKLANFFKFFNTGPTYDSNGDFEIWKERWIRRGFNGTSDWPLDPDFIRDISTSTADTLSRSRGDFIGDDYYTFKVTKKKSTGETNVSERPERPE